MQVTNDTIEWTSDNAALLHEFLKTPTGQRLLPRIAEQVPALLSGGDVNALLIRSGEVRGYQDALRNLLAASMPTPEPAKAESSYPSLDDPANWNE
jgi:hypothetical protein